MTTLLHPSETGSDLVELPQNMKRPGRCYQHRHPGPDRHGRTAMSNPTPALSKHENPLTAIEEKRFWSRVDTASDDACWHWKGKADKAGYGRFYFRGRSSFPAHRLSWAIANGRMPTSGAYICHRCDNPSCVNPAHLFEGSPKDNHADMVRKGRASFEEDHCRAGHALTDDNVTIRPNGDRRCWKCMRAREREWRAENRDRLNAKQRERYAEKKRREAGSGR